jgi:phytoene synthase
MTVASSEQDPQIAQAITRSSKSNLALAFVALSRERRRAATTFYAFCRTIDDIADEPGRLTAEKERELAEWKLALRSADGVQPPLAAAVRELIRAYAIPVELMEEIIDGCAMDLVPARYATFEDLQRYCYRVASVVGLVSIEIFGYRNPSARQYAIELGYALQLTNILRDVAADLENEGRVYLPEEDLQRFGVTLDDLHHRRGGPHFQKLMAFEAERAEGFYERAVAALAPEDRRSMRAAEIMRRVYHRLLRQMKASGYRVFERHYRLRRLEKLAIILSVLLSRKNRR